MTDILYRISSFSEEVDQFEIKYGRKFLEFRKKYEYQEKSFNKYDELMAWEFAQQGKEYWEKKSEELKNVL